MFLRLVLVVLLLAAQHAALTHAIWHARGSPAVARQLPAWDALPVVGAHDQRLDCIA